MTVYVSLITPISCRYCSANNFACSSLGQNCKLGRSTHAGAEHCVLERQILKKATHARRFAELAGMSHGEIDFLHSL